MADFNTPVGFGFIAGRGRERAKQVLAATEAAGFDQEKVLTRPGGYLAPQEVVDSIAESDDAAAREANTETKTKVEESAPAPAESPAPAPAETASPTPDGTAPTQEPVKDEAAENQPAGNASTEDWAAWAVKYKGYDAGENLSRTELIERYSA